MGSGWCTEPDPEPEPGENTVVVREATEEADDEADEGAEERESVARAGEDRVEEVVEVVVVAAGELGPGPLAVAEAVAEASMAPAFHMRGSCSFR